MLATVLNCLAKPLIVDKSSSSGDWTRQAPPETVSGLKYAFMVEVFLCKHNLDMLTR